MTSLSAHKAVALAAIVVFAVGCGADHHVKNLPSSVAPARGLSGQSATRLTDTNSTVAGAAQAPVGGAANASGGSSGGSSAVANPAPALPALFDGRSLVVTGSLEMHTPDAGKAAAAATAIVRSVDGYISEQDTRDHYATFTVRVRPDRYDTLVNQLASLGTDVHRSANTSDVTDQVVDVASRVKSQQASVERVRFLLARATTLGDVVEVEGELARREADLESLQARQRALSAQTDLATLTVSFTESDHLAATAKHSRGFTAGLAQGWRAFVGAGAVVLTGLGRLLPFVGLIAFLGLLARSALRHRRRAAIPVTTE